MRLAPLLGLLVVLWGAVMGLPSHGAYLRPGGHQLVKVRRNPAALIDAGLSGSHNAVKPGERVRDHRPRTMNSRSISDEFEEIPGSETGGPIHISPHSPGSLSTAALVALAFIGMVVVAVLSFLGLRYLYEKFSEPGRGYITINSDDLLPGGPAKKVKVPTLDTIKEGVTDVAEEGRGQASSAIAKGKEKVQSALG